MFVVKNHQKRMSVLALFGLFMILSMLLTSVVNAQTMGDQQVTEEIILASPDFVDSTGNGGEEDGGVPTATPTPEEILDETDFGEEDPGLGNPDEGEPGEEDPGEEDPGDEDSGLGNPDEGEPGEEFPGEEDLDEGDPEPSDTSTPQPEDNSELAPLMFLGIETEEGPRTFYYPDIRVSITNSGDACGPNLTLTISVENKESYSVNNVSVTVSIVSGGNYISHPSFPLTITFDTISKKSTESESISLTTNVDWENAPHNSQIKIKAYIDQPIPNKSQFRSNTTTIKKPNNCTTITCPNTGNGWIKVDSINALSYMYTAPDGKLVESVCYKAGTTKIEYDVSPPESPHTVNSTVLNPVGNNYQNISHASFKLVDVPVKIDPPIDVAQNCVWNGSSDISVTFTMEGVASLTWASGSTYTPSSPEWSGNTLILSNLTPGTYDFSYIGADGYNDGSVSALLLVGCEPASFDIDQSCQWVDSSSKVDVTFSNLVGITSITWDGIEYTEFVTGSLILENQTLGSHNYSWTVQSGYTGSGSDSILLIGCEPLDLILSETCLVNGNHQWTVTNPNPDPIIFNWYTDETPPLQSGGPLAVPGKIGDTNGTVTFTSDPSMHTMNVEYAYPEAGLSNVVISLTTESECAMPHNTLQIEPVCSFPTDLVRTWKIINNNSYPVNYWITKNYYQAEYNLIAPPGVSYIQTGLSTWIVNVFEGYSWVASAMSTGPCYIDLTLDYSCLDNGDHLWTVSNPNAAEIEFQWKNNHGSYSDWISLTGNSSTTITIADSSIQTMYINYRIALGGGKYLTGSTFKFAFQCDTFNPPTIDVECVMKHGVMKHKWTIHNPNNFSIWYKWSSTSGESDDAFKMLLANSYCHDCDTGTFYTDFSAQTLTVYYKKFAGEVKSFTVNAEACDLVDLDIEITGGGESCEDFDFNIRVTNTAAHLTATNVDVTISVTDGAVYIDGFAGNPLATQSIGNLGPGQFVDIPLSIDTINSLWMPAAAGTTIEFEVAAASDQDNSSKSGSAVHPGSCALNPEIDYQCREFDNSHIWFVNNPNPFPIEIKWKIDDSEYTGSWLEIPAGAEVDLDPTSSVLQTMTLKYRYGSNPEIVMDPQIAEECKTSGLELSFVCGYPSDTELYWQVDNPFDFDVDITWEVLVSGENGSASVPANGNTVFTTGLNADTVTLSVNGNEVDQANSGDACLFDLELTYRCLYNGTHLWTVTNNNKDEVTFNWYKNGVAGGTGIGVKAERTATFTTNNGEHTVRIEHEDDIFGTKVVESLAEACKVVEEPETPTSYSSILKQPEIGVCQEWLIFHTYREGSLEIFRLDGIEGVGDYQLFNLSKSVAIDTRPSRSFDDAWVAFQSKRDGNYEIYYTDSAGNEQIRLTDNPADDINPVFRSNNTDIVFQSDRNGNWDLFMVNRITGLEIQLTDHESDEINPFFAQNSNLLVYESNRNDKWDVFILNIATGVEYQVTNGEEDEIYPALSPNGQKIAYLSQVDGIWQLFVIGIDGTNKIQMTNADGDSFNPSWSPDSTRLAYQSEREGNLDIYSYDLRNGTEYQVTNNEGKDYGPTWDCAGMNLSYTTQLNGSASDIYAIFWQGGDPSFLTNHPGTDKWSVWSPTMEMASRSK